MKEILDRLKQIRHHSKLNQTEFAKRLGITQSTYSGIENGRETLTDRNIGFICLTFGINEDWLRTGEGEMFKAYEPVSPTILDLDGKPLNREESELIELYRKLLDPTQEVILESIKQMYILQEKLKTPPTAAGSELEKGKQAGIGPQEQDRQTG